MNYKIQILIDEITILKNNESLEDTHLKMLFDKIIELSYLIYPNLNEQQLPIYDYHTSKIKRLLNNLEIEQEGFALIINSGLAKPYLRKGLMLFLEFLIENSQEVYNGKSNQ